MRLAEVGHIFWIAKPTRAEPKLTAHVIIRVDDGFTPADSECEEYVAKCGRTGQSWASADMGVPETRVVKDKKSIPEHVQLCSICFP